MAQLKASTISKMTLFLVAGMISISTMAADFNQVQRLANQGDSSAQFDLGMLYYHDEGLRQDSKKAHEWFLKAANQGHVKAQYRLGEMYGGGYGVHRDYAKAHAWLQKSADQGDAESQWVLGEAYSGGYGVPKNNIKAIDFYQKAANQELRYSYSLAVLYATGRDNVPKNYMKVLEWAKKASDKGHDSAFYYIGNYFYSDDINKKIEIYQLGAEQGDITAAYELGEMYIYGIDDYANRDPARAAKLYRVAANQGHAKAQYQLGEAYRNGNGVRQDRTQAKEWYGKSCDNGNNNGCDLYRLMNEPD